MTKEGFTLRRLSLGLIALTGIAILAVLLSLPDTALASVSLSSFYAEPDTDRIVLHWETESEVDTLGFNIWRGTQCNASVSERVNGGLIPATGQGALGDSYTLADTDSDLEEGVLYDYRIEDVDNAGQATCHHEYPVQARLTGGNPIFTPTPNTGPGGAPTSTSAPTNTPAPTDTPAPPNTPPPAGDDQSATATASPESTAEATVEQELPTATVESVSVPTETPAPPGDDEFPASGVEAVADNGGDVESDSTAEAGVVGEDPQATADAQATAEVAGAEEVTELAEAGATAPANTVGAGQDAPAATQEEASASTEDGSSSRNAVTVILVMIGGLFFTLGGIAAVWFFVINRNG